jgi:hypothetical protein
VRKKLLFLRHALHAVAQNHPFYGCTDVGFSGQRYLQAASILSCTKKTVIAATHAGISRALLCYFPGLHLRQYLLSNVDHALLTAPELFDGEGVLTGRNYQHSNEGSQSWDKSSW